MAIGILASSMRSIIGWATDPFSVSKPTMKPAVTDMPACIDLMHAVGNAAARILFLAHRLERFLVRAFDADEDREEV